MNCLTQSLRQAGIKNIEPCGIIRVFAGIDKGVGTTKLISDVQKEANRLFPKIDYIFNCKFTIQSVDDKYGGWIS